MTSNKSTGKKNALGKKARENRRLPLFVIARTDRKVSRNNKSRNWRRQKMKLKEK